MTSAMEMRALVPSTWLTSGFSPQTLRPPPPQLRPRRSVERGPTAQVTERPVRKRARLGHSLDVLKGLFTLLAWPMLVHLLFKFTDILNRWDGVFRHTGLRVLIFIGAAVWLMKASLTSNFEKTTSALNQSLAESFEGFGLQSWLAQKISHFIISVSWWLNVSWNTSVRKRPNLVQNRRGNESSPHAYPEPTAYHDFLITFTYISLLQLLKLMRSNLQSMKFCMFLLSSPGHYRFITNNLGLGCGEFWCSCFARHMDLGSDNLRTLDLGGVNFRDHDGLCHVNILGQRDMGILKWRIKNGNATDLTILEPASWNGICFFTRIKSAEEEKSLGGKPLGKERWGLCDFSLFCMPK